MPKTGMDISELLAKQNGGVFGRSFAEAVMPLIMAADADSIFAKEASITNLIRGDVRAN